MKKLTWEEVESAADELARKISASGFKPDYILGVTTGGLIPLFLLSKRLGIKNILTVSARSAESTGKLEPEITYLPIIDLTGKKVLLVDEIVETGKTLRKISEAVLGHYQLAELKVATLGVNIDRVQFEPDFYVLTQQGDWMLFPWEQEDGTPYII